MRCVADGGVSNAWQVHADTHIHTSLLLDTIEEGRADIEIGVDTSTDADADILRNRDGQRHRDGQRRADAYKW